MRVELPEANRPNFLPPDMQDGLRTSAAKLAGALLFLIALALWVSMLTWSTSDPGLSRDALSPPQNLLGAPGALMADVMLQTFGLSAVLLVVPMATWGWLLFSRGQLRGWSLRILLMLPVIAMLPGAVSFFPAPQAWPIPHGLGGLAGDATFALLQPLFNVGARGLYSSFVGLILSCTLVVAMARLSGVRYRHVQMIFSGGAMQHPDDAPIYRSFNLFGWIRPRAGRLTPLTAETTGWGRVRAHSDDGAGDLDAGRTEPTFDPELDFVPYRAFDDHEDEMRLNGLGDDVDEESRNLAARFAPKIGKTPEPTGEREGKRDDDTRTEDMPAFLRQVQTPVSPRRTNGGRSGYRPPALNLLQRVANGRGAGELSQAALRGNARLLEDTLAEFGVKGEIVQVRPGPVVTLYELEPARGVKTSRVVGLSDDIARSMGAVSARIAVIPGRNAIGIELPNERRDMVALRDLLGADLFRRSEAKLALAMGKAINGDPIIADLASMPHLLVAGTTGSGKSVGINAMVLSLLYRLSPEQCRMIMIDPKMLELSVYNGIPHLLTPVVTDPKKAVAALNWVVREMEERYTRMSKLGVRNIGVFNNRVINARKQGEQLRRSVQTGYDAETGEAVYEHEDMASETMPHIVVIVDEMADLMMVAGKDIEASVQRLAQMARAAGIHLIMATQRPSVDVITGTIKANFPSRASFKVASKIDSRTILNEQGAEQLLGAGDMLFSQGGGQLARVHGAFVSDEEVELIADYLRSQGTPDYVTGITKLPDDGEGSGAGGQSGGSEDLYDKAIAVVLRDQKVSTSYLQRKLGIGYNRAADLVDRMEEEGVIGPAGSGGKREIL